MGLRKFKPTTPGQRHKVALTFEDITTSKPEKSLLGKKKRSGGRNDTGKMTIENIGGGHKKRYRIIDFKRNKFNIPAKVASIEYDPNRTANIALLNYADGEKRYIISPEGLKVGNEVLSGPKSPINVGNTLPIANLPLGTVIHNIELKPGQGAILVRSAGSYNLSISTPSGFFASRLLEENAFFQAVVHKHRLIQTTTQRAAVFSDARPGWAQEQHRSNIGVHIGDREYRQQWRPGGDEGGGCQRRWRLRSGRQQICHPPSGRGAK